MQYLHNETLPHDSMDAKKSIKEASYYTVIRGQLYRKSLSQPLSKCLSMTKMSFIHEEVHEGSYGYHLDGKPLAIKVLRAGYYWPTMIKDIVDFIKKCSKCQQHAHFHIAPAEKLSTIISPWPFSKWGIDLLGPFPLTLWHVKYLIVAIDYFTKWIKAELLSIITAAQAQKFV